MEAPNDNQAPNEDGFTPRKFGMITRLIFRLTGVDEATMSECPEHDVDNVRALGWLLIASFVWQTLLLSLIGHRLFAAPGEIRPELLLGAAGIAFFVLMIDSYIFYRSGFETAGIDEIRRGGLDIGGPGLASRIGYLVARGVLSIGFAQLTAIFVALIIFAADIDARIQATYQRANTRLLSSITVIVDGDIKRADVAVKTQAARVDSLSNQVTTLRQHDIDPSASDPQLQQAQQEMTRLLDDKSKADDAVTAAQNFGSMELGGVKSVPGNSGIAGNGPRYRAAMQAAENAKRHAQEVAGNVESARTRLDGLRRELASSNEAEKQRSHGELPGYEATLATEESKLATLKEDLDALITGRVDAIRRGVESAPDYVPLNKGFLAQLIALEQIADEDRKIATVIFLIDLVSFGLELAAVLAKVSSYVPMKYSALLARNAYATAVKIVDELMAELESGSTNDSTKRNDGERAEDHDDLPSPEPSNDNTPDDPATNGSDPFSPPAIIPPSQPKRRRGRPRKNPLN